VRCDVVKQRLEMLNTPLSLPLSLRKSVFSKKKDVEQQVLWKRNDEKNDGKGGKKRKERKPESDGQDAQSSLTISVRSFSHVRRVALHTTFSWGDPRARHAAWLGTVDV